MLRDIGIIISIEHPSHTRRVFTINVQSNKRDSGVIGQKYSSLSFAINYNDMRECTYNNLTLGCNTYVRIHKSVNLYCALIGETYRRVF